jgi:transglutaminase-like putative cysteine protease
MEKTAVKKVIWFGLFLCVLLAGCITKSDPNPSDPIKPPTKISSQRYKVLEQLTVINEGPNQPQKQNIWIALIGDVSPYQKVLSRQISPNGYVIIEDEYGNQYAEFDLGDMQPGEEIRLEIQYHVEVYQLAYDLDDCQGQLPDEFTHPELHIESKNPQIVDLATQLFQDTGSACESAAEFYNYIGDNLVYTYNKENWGAQAALGEMGSDCTEYASLMIALSRAVSIPARYFEGLVYFSDQSDAIARTEHAWLEVYLPEIGWAPMDPTLGRFRSYRDDYFAKIPPDHIIVTRGRNPSTLRGSSYWTHLYWPGNSTTIRIKDSGWIITPLDS